MFNLKGHKFMDLINVVLVLHSHRSLPLTSFPHSLQTLLMKNPPPSTSHIQTHLHANSTHLNSVNMLSVTEYKGLCTLKHLMKQHSVNFSLFWVFFFSFFFFFFRYLTLSCLVYPVCWLPYLLPPIWSCLLRFAYFKKINHSYICFC